MRIVLLACLGFTCFPMSSVSAEGSPFQAGQVSLGLTGGGGPGGFGVGLDVGYMVLDSVEVSFGSAYWVLEETNLVQLTPGVRYIIEASESVMPYVGVFGRRWFFTEDTYSDVTSMGARAGLYLLHSGGSIVTAGVAYEEILGCSDELKEQCTSIYPEFGLALLF